MPMDGRAWLQLSLLILALPAQYLITKYAPATVSARDLALRKYES